MHRSGMTLVEILIVLAIVGVMAGAVTLGVGVSDRRMGVETEANRLADRLRLASDDVLTTRRPLALAFDERGYGFVREDEAATGLVDALAERHALPAGVRMTGVDAISPVTIDPDGAQPVIVIGLSKGEQRWQVAFDGLNAVATPVLSEAGA